MSNFLSSLKLYSLNSSLEIGAGHYFGPSDVLANLGYHASTLDLDITRQISNINPGKHIQDLSTKRVFPSKENKSENNEVKRYLGDLNYINSSGDLYKNLLIYYFFGVVFIRVVFVHLLVKVDIQKN